MRQNLAESSLTTGQYDQAILLTRALMEGSTDPSTLVNMKFILFAALTMKGDRPGADTALAELNQTLKAVPKDFRNMWEYTGTKNYINRIAQGATRQLLLQTLSRISPQS